MRNKELEKIISFVCNSSIDVIMVAIEEDKMEKEFPYAIACSNLMCELKEKNIMVDFNDVFNDDIMEKIVREVNNFLVR